MRRNKLGIALGGGSGRGTAHLGIIKCLEEEGIHPDVITGTSIGALLGSLYAYGISFDQIVAAARDILGTDEFKNLGFEFFADHKKEQHIKRFNSYIKERLIYAKMVITPYITERETLRKVIEKIIPDVNIEDLPISFATATLDLISGKDVFISKGPLIEAVVKAISIAGIFPAWEIDGKILVDGGPTANVPVEATYSLGADKVIGVNLSNKLSRDFELKSAISTNFRVDEIAKFRLNKSQAEKADVLIKPNMESIHWADFSKIDYGIKEGYRAAKEHIKEIRALVRPSLPLRIKRLFSK
jgi:NTE family protein